VRSQNPSAARLRRPRLQTRAQTAGSQRLLKINEGSHRFSKTLSYSPNAATYSASHATPTRNSNPGSSNRKLGVSGTSLPVIRLSSIRTLNFTLCTTRFCPGRESTWTLFSPQYTPGTTLARRRCPVHPRAESVSRAFGRTQSAYTRIREPEGVVTNN
jgi:hypothetical protein